MAPFDECLHTFLEQDTLASWLGTVEIDEAWFAHPALVLKEFQDFYDEFLPADKTQGASGDVVQIGIVLGYIVILTLLEMQLKCWFFLEIVHFNLNQFLEVLTICDFLAEPHGVYEGSLLRTVEYQLNLCVFHWIHLT